MKKFLLVVCFCLVHLVCITGCSKPDKKAAAKTAVINPDSIFIKKYLPEIRDAFCAETLSVQYLKHFFKGKILSGKGSIGGKWVQLFADSTNRCVHLDIDLKEDNTISGIEIKFPEGLWQKEQMVPIFGRYADPYGWESQMKDGVVINFLFRKKCNSAIRVSAWLNVGGSLRSINMFYDTK
jgi:hypothetical protein